VFKIAPDNFQAALAALGSIGEVRSQSITTDDVTRAVVDLESRISTAEASVERLKEFLGTAGDIDTIAQLEAQLLERETTLEVLRGQLRTLQDAVSLATITITLTEALSNPQMAQSVSSYASIEDDGASCPGSSEVGILEGEPATVCFELADIGDTLLTDFTLRDAVLGVELDNLTLVWGDNGVPLEPGQSLIFSTEVTVDRTLRGQTRATAVPVNENGDPVEAREVSQTAAVFLYADEVEGLPGFADGLSGSLDLLKQLGGLIILIAGVAVPFLWVIVLYVVWRRWRKNKLAKLAPPATTVVED